MVQCVGGATDKRKEKKQKRENKKRKQKRENKKFYEVRPLKIDFLT
jgi:hypothetical protein